MPLPSSGPLSSSQVATEFGVSQADISLANLGTYIDIESGPVALSDFYGTSGNTPTLTTSAPSSVTSTSMTLNGNVTNQGASSVTNRGFYFGTNSNYASNTKTQVGSGTGTYTLAKTGLTAGTTYYITAYAINTQGEARGSTVSQATSGGSTTEGSAMRYGTTDNLSIANRISRRRDVSLIAECFYELNDIDKFIDFVKETAKEDKSNIRLAAISAFVSNQLGHKYGYPFCRNPLNYIHFSNIKERFSSFDQFNSNLLDELKKVDLVWEPKNRTTKVCIVIGTG